VKKIERLTALIFT